VRRSISESYFVNPQHLNPFAQRVHCIYQQSLFHCRWGRGPTVNRSFDAKYSINISEEYLKFVTDKSAEAPPQTITGKSESKSELPTFGWVVNRTSMLCVKPGFDCKLARLQFKGPTSMRQESNPPVNSAHDGRCLQ